VGVELAELEVFDVDELLEDVDDGEFADGGLSGVVEELEFCVEGSDMVGN